MRSPACGLVLVHRRDQARRAAKPEHKKLVGIAAEVLADDAGRLGITYAGLYLTGLPPERLAGDRL